MRGAAPSNPAGGDPLDPPDRSPFYIWLRCIGAASSLDLIEYDSMHNLFLQDVCEQYAPKCMWCMFVIFHDLRVMGKATRLEPYVLSFIVMVCVPTCDDPNTM